MRKKIALGIGALALSALTLVGCTSSAEKVNENVTTAADNFEVQRTIIGVNGITGENAFFVEGRCSITADTTDNQLEVLCKHGPDDYRKHFIGLSDNTYYVVTQSAGIDVSEYHTRIILKPQNVIPEFDIVMGETP